MQDVSNGNLFCNVKEVLDTNVNIPPHPPDDHTTTNATCASSVPWGKRSTRTLTSPPPPPWRSYDNISNMYLFHVQHVKKSKISNPIPPFRKTSFLKFATLPRDRKWHISKSTTLPRAPYQPHAKNNCGKPNAINLPWLGMVVVAPMYSDLGRGWLLDDCA